MNYFYDPTSLHDLIQHSLTQHGDLPYIYEYIDGVYEPKSYRDFIADIYRAVQLLDDLGLRGKRVMLYGKNSYEWLVFYTAITAYVGVCVCANKDWKCYDMENAILATSPDFIICDKDLEQYICDSKNDRRKGSLQKLFHKLRLCNKNNEQLETRAHKKDEITVIIFTTGTTGLPKAVPLSLATMFASGRSLYAQVLTTPEDSYYLFLPLHHIYCQFGVAMAAFTIGASLYLAHDLRHFVEEAKAGQPTIIPGVPLFFERILAGINKKDMQQIHIAVRVLDLIHASKKIRRVIFKKVHEAFGGNVRILTSAAAQLNRDTKYLLRGMGFDLIEGYGMSETSGAVSIEHIYSNPVIGSVGKILEPQKIKIKKPAADGYGEVLVKGENVMSGYLINNKIDRSNFDKDGYFATGDEGYVDEDNNLYIRGRIGKIITLSSGEKVSVDEIVSLLMALKIMDKVYLNEKDGYINGTIFSHKEVTKVNKSIELLNNTLPKYKQLRSWTQIKEYNLSEIKE